MSQILVRFIVGGFVVSFFALIGDLLKPKSFAGLFGAAPSVALATLALTAAKEGSSYAASEARSMMVGALAFFCYASFVSWIMMRYKSKALGSQSPPSRFGSPLHSDSGWRSWAEHANQNRSFGSKANQVASVRRPLPVRRIDYSNRWRDREEIWRWSRWSLLGISGNLSRQCNAH